MRYTPAIVLTEAFQFGFAMQISLNVPTTGLPLAAFRAPLNWINGGTLDKGGVC
jgi:hypothetical protein